MSEQNVELVRRMNQAFNNRDVEAMLEMCADDVQIEDLHPAPDMPPVAHGKHEVLRLIAGWVDAFDEFGAEIAEFIDVDDRHVAVVVRYRGTQRDTGVVVDMRGVDLWEFDDGKLIRGTVGYPDRDAALAAAATTRA